MLKLNSNKSVHIKYKKFKELVKYIVCVWSTPYWKHPNTAAFCLLEHPSDFFIINTHMPTIHMHTHHSKVLNPDTSSRENVEMIWLILRKSVISRILLFFYYYFFIEAACVTSLCSILTAPEFNIWNVKSLIYL